MDLVSESGAKAKGRREVEQPRSKARAELECSSSHSARNVITLATYATYKRYSMLSSTVDTRVYNTRGRSETSVA